jgi:dipeptidase E
MDMKTLLLTSAGTDIKEEILNILPKSPSQMKLAHIITASKVEPDTNYVTKDHDNFETMGFNVIDIDIEGRTETELTNILDGYDVICVQGGNTFYLLNAVKESGFFNVIKKLIDNGVIYIGISAGSIIMGPTIETTGWKGTWPDKNTVKLKNMKGLDLVPFNLFVHYEPRWEKSVKAAIAKSKYRTRLLTDKQGFLVKGNKIELVGEQPEIVLN